MNELNPIGKALIVAGTIFILFGLILVAGGRIPWLGKLPGDIIVQKKNFAFYFPVATCLAISIVISLFYWLWSRR
ncbi:DUF2905 domain-containing protein [Candidatus Omnitrophota bacterium]